MKKQLQNKVTYAPNPSVKVTVVNTPEFDETGQKLGYKAKVTINYTTSKLDEVKFVTDDDIAEFVGAIDFTDPQQEMFSE